MSSSAGVVSSHFVIVTGSPVLRTTTVWGLAFLDGSDQFVLAGGQVHGLYVEAFGLVLVVAADHHDGDVGLRGCIGRGFEIIGARFGGVVGWVFAFHADAQRGGDLDAGTGALLDSLERRDRILWPHERTASTAGARDECVGTDHCDRMDLRWVEREQVVLIFEKHDAFGCAVTRYFLLFGRVHFAECGVGMNP